MGVQVEVLRNHDIRYFAVDSRLYPVGGLYNARAGYHGYSPTGIFCTPTTLSGLDPNMYISLFTKLSVVRAQLLRELSRPTKRVSLISHVNRVGATVDLIELVDINYDQQPEFFETMIAHRYVGYGTSTLGITTESAQPGQLFGGARAQGTPGSILQYARPMPGR